MRLLKENKEILRQMVYQKKRLYSDYPPNLYRDNLQRCWIADEFNRNLGAVHIDIKMAQYFIKNRLIEYDQHAKNYKVSTDGIKAVADKKIVARAEKVLEKKRIAFKPKNYMHYLVFVDDDENVLGEVEIDIGSEFCEDCIDKAVEKYNEEFDNGEIQSDEDGACKIEWRQYDGSSDCFIHCADCGELIAHSLLLDDPEINYWLHERDCGPDGKPLRVKKYSNKEAYMLTEIIYQHPCDEYTPMIERLAAKIIEVEKGGVA